MGKRYIMNITNINYAYLRPKKACVLKEWTDAPFEKLDTLEVWSGNNATILPLKTFPQDGYLFGRAGVVDCDGNYVDSSAIERRVQSAYPVENPEYRDERVIYCGYWVKQWGHFLVESVARLWYALESTEKLIFVTDYGCESQFYGNYKEFLQLLGVYDRIEVISKPTKFREVLVPQLGYKWRAYYSDQYRSIFSRIAGNVDTPDGWRPADKIFLSRSKLKNINKKEYGYDMLDSYFARNGYQIVHPQDISLSELIRLLKHCSECASISGTLPHNMLFAADRSNLTIVERNVLNNEIQVDVNHIKQLNVTYIDANLAIYPINLGYGPFMMAYNHQFAAFTESRGYQKPDDRYLSKRYIKKGFIRYMQEYQRYYSYQWYMSDWMIGYTDYMHEAYTDSLEYIGDYILGKKPFQLRHYFMPQYWKQFIKLLLKR